VLDRTIATCFLGKAMIYNAKVIVFSIVKQEKWKKI